MCRAIRTSHLTAPFQGVFVFYDFFVRIFEPFHKQLNISPYGRATSALVYMGHVKYKGRTFLNLKIPLVTTYFSLRLRNSIISLAVVNICLADILLAKFTNLELLS